MPSTSDSLQPYLLSNFDLVTESLTLIAGNGSLGDRRRRMVLGREYVAGGPADVGAQGLERLDQHRRLDRHVQRTGDARALERLLVAEFLAAGHQARHFGFGDLDLLAAPAG